MKRNKYLEQLKAYWKVDDPEWLKQRKQEWKKVKHNLSLFTKGNKYFKTVFHKHHQELFMYGTITPESWSLFDKSERIDNPDFDTYAKERLEYVTGIGKREFLESLPLFILWYIPELSDRNFSILEDMFRDYATPENQSLYEPAISARERLFGQFCCDIGLLNSAVNFLHPTYGLMGGREEVAVKLLFPGYDYKNKYHVFKASTETIYDPVTYEPSLVFGKCYGGSVMELCADARYYPNSPGIYLWDHLSYVFEKYPEQVEKNIKFKDRYFPMLFARILTFHERTDPSRYRPSTIKFVESVLERYETKKFSSNLLKYFEIAKKDIKELTKFDEEERIFTMTERGLLKTSKLRRPKRKPFSIKEQRARRAMWDQIDIITEV